MKMSVCMATYNGEKYIYAQLAERVNPISIFVGHGFGIGVPIRPVHFEISFLEIFHKQGLLGLMFWLIFLRIIVYNYTKIRSYEYKKIALGFLLSSMFIYIQTQTNPFMNNPIGMSFLLISVISLQILKQEERRGDPNAAEGCQTHGAISGVATVVQ